MQKKKTHTKRIVLTAKDHRPVNIFFIVGGQVIDKPEYKFIYKDEYTYGNNFLRWRARNNEEKLLYGEDEYTLLQAKEVFDKIYFEKKAKESE